MSFLTKRLYHGSDKKFNKIEPLGVNMGTRFSKPKLSSFFWATREKALGWAIYQVLRRQGNIKSYYHIPTGGFIITPENAKLAQDFLRHSVGYVYHADVRLDKVGVGSSPDIEEFTINETIVPNVIEEINFRLPLIRQYMQIAKQEEINNYLNDISEGKYANSRGLILTLLLDRERDLKRHDTTVRKELGLEDHYPSSDW